MYLAVAGSCAEQKANAATAPAYTLDGISFSNYVAATGLLVTELENSPSEMLLLISCVMLFQRHMILVLLVQPKLSILLCIVRGRRV